MNSNGNMDGSGHKGSNELPADWTWERFHVVDAGNGEIALWSEIHGKYVTERLPGSLGVRICLCRARLHAAFCQWLMTKPAISRVQSCKARYSAVVSSDHSLSPFRATVFTEPFVSAYVSVVSFLHPASLLQIRMHENGNMDASGSKGKDNLPSDWTWERFKVVDAGNGQWALWNPIHNRYMRLHSDGNMDGSGHKGPRHCPPSGLDGKEGRMRS